MIFLTKRVCNVKSVKDMDNVSHVTLASSRDLTDKLLVQEKAKSAATDSSTKSVTTDEEHDSTKSDSDSGEDSEIDEEAHQDAYENMYAQCLRVCNENCALVSKNSTLVYFKVKAKDKFDVLEALIAEEEEKIKEFSAKFERTQKHLKMLNIVLTQLDQIFLNNKRFRDHKGLGSISEFSKTIFIQSTAKLVSVSGSSVMTKGKAAIQSVATSNTRKAVMTNQMSVAHPHNFERPVVIVRQPSAYFNNVQKAKEKFVTTENKEEFVAT